MHTIEIKTIPQKSQRYLTVGNYFEKGHKWVFEISEMGYRSEAAVAVHELIEKILCYWSGIEDDDITQFDIVWEERNKKRPAKYAEPGDDPKAPYHFQHVLAKKVEKLMVKIMGLSWKEHSRIVDDVFETDPRSK